MTAEYINRMTPAPLLYWPQEHAIYGAHPYWQ